MNIKYFLFTLWCFSLIKTEQIPTEKPFTVQDFEKIKIPCDKMLEDIGRLYGIIIKTREELKNNPHQQLGLRIVSIKINEIEFLTLYNYYQQNCLKK